MLRVLGVIVIIAVYIWFAVDVARTPRSEARALPKWLWLIIVLVLPIIGGILWLMLGRPRYPGTRWRRRAPLAPDDDPRFLRKLDEEAWREKMRRRRGEVTE